jgi:hypothetical protein
VRETGAGALRNAGAPLERMTRSSDRVGARGVGITERSWNQAHGSIEQVAGGNVGGLATDSSVEQRPEVE